MPYLSAGLPHRRAHAQGGDVDGADWQQNADGVWSRDTADYRLTIVTIGGLARFMVHTHPHAAERGGVLVASGTTSGVAAAMAGAEATARRMTVLSIRSAAAGADDLLLHVALPDRG